MAAVGAIGIAVARDLGYVQVILVGIGTLLLAVSILRSEGAERRSTRGAVFAGAVVIAVFLATTIPLLADAYFGTWSAAARAGIGMLALGGVLVPWLQTPQRQRFVGIVIIWMVLVLGFLAVVAIPDSGVDVQYAHEEASRLLFSGKNPYSDLVIADTAPSAVNEGTIVGYSYPPVAMVVYAAAEQLGDSRFANVALIGGLLAMVLVRAGRSTPNGVLLVGVLGSLPFLGGMVIAGWTEPLQAILVVAAAFVYRRWVLSSILLGLAIASKQYMLLVAVPLIILAGEDRLRRLTLALATVAATYLPFFLWNPSAMWDALVGHQLGRLARTDVASVWALGFEIPIFVGVAVATLAGVAVCRGVPRVSSVLAVQALVLAVLFVLMPNSFLNFWFLVLAMIVGWLALEVGVDDRSDGKSGDLVPLGDGAAIHG